MRFITLVALLANASFTSAKDFKPFKRAVVERNHGPHNFSVVNEAPTGIDVTVLADAPIPISTAMPAVVDHKKEVWKA
jgi:hypothetical protein